MSAPVVRSRKMRSAPLLVAAAAPAAAPTAAVPPPAPAPAACGRLNRTATHLELGANFHELAFGIALFSPVARLSSSRRPGTAGACVFCPAPRPPGVGA